MNQASKRNLVENMCNRGELAYDTQLYAAAKMVWCRSASFPWGRDVMYGTAQFANACACLFYSRVHEHALSCVYKLILLD